MRAGLFAASEDPGVLRICDCLACPRVLRI